MDADLLAVAHRLAQQGEPFALATVVRRERPTSAKPGATALIRQDGTMSGWIGGSCAEPVLVKEALAALVDGEPRLLLFAGEAASPLGRAADIREYAMTCHSGGTLEIYVEPVLPNPELILVGSGPVVETLARLATAAGFAATVVAREGAEAPLAGARLVDDLARVALTPRTAVVVATHGRFDEDALEQALWSEADYVSLVASPKRTGAVVEALRARGVPDERSRRLKAPAGLDLGAVTPEEIAISILAEIIARRRRPRSETTPERDADVRGTEAARDPVCGMTVVIATARHRSEAARGPVYFCCAACKRAFDLEPARYTAASPT
jgi:xanthine dehydrogenase accessory factor